MKNGLNILDNGFSFNPNVRTIRKFHDINFYFVVLWVLHLWCIVSHLCAACMEICSFFLLSGWNKTHVVSKAKMIYMRKFEKFQMWKPDSKQLQLLNLRRVSLYELYRINKKQNINIITCCCTIHTQKSLSRLSLTVCVNQKYWRCLQLD